MITRFLAACAAVVYLAAVSLPSSAQTGQTHGPREDPNSGPYLYRTYCVSCHGTHGKGDGPAVRTLLAQPPDLTTIAARNGGVFPSANVARIIDGRTSLPGHRRADMPRWGAVLSAMEARDELAVKTRITALVSHLESLQAPVK